MKGEGWGWGWGWGWDEALANPHRRTWLSAMAWQSSRLSLKIGRSARCSLMLLVECCPNARLAFCWVCEWCYVQVRNTTDDGFKAPSTELYLLMINFSEQMSYDRVVALDENNNFVIRHFV